MSNKYHAHHAIEMQVVVFAVLTGCIGLVTGVIGALMLPAPNGWLAIGGAVVLVAMSVALWLAREWARITAGVTALVALVAFSYWTRPEYFERGVKTKVALLAYGVYLLAPSTRHAFAEARAARRREQEAIREAGSNRRNSRPARTKTRSTPPVN